MIPEFDANGNLPPGVWPATIDEVEARYATNANRRRLFHAFREVVEILRAANCPEVFLDGGYICSSDDPEDYDMCYEWRGMKPTDDFRALLEAGLEARKERHLGDIFIRMPRPPYIEDYVEYWQTDRDDNLKGIIRVEL